MKYINIKVTVWNRLHLKEDTDLSRLIACIQRGGIEAAIDCQGSFRECETLYPSECLIDPPNNGGYATMEIYEDQEVKWKNDK